ncbi:hypothetical protein [uncultured Roseobacter sp.]|uniref:hypothetical protein n=1 Tax=uncultured Roseobacter sp. TaxID=114847 RepID=UPI00260E5E4A|nr:hypothetical protein [uncultured Roseobacter sp.]
MGSSLTLKLANAINDISAAGSDSRAHLDLEEIGDLFAPLIPERIERRRIIRPEDLFVADLVLHNLSVTPGPPQRLIRTIQSRPAHLCLGLQGQHFGEETLVTGAANGIPSDLLSGELEVPPPAPRVMRARLAYPSRVVVRMPQTQMALDYTVDAILKAITTWPLNLDPLARSLPVFAEFGVAELTKTDLSDLVKVDALQNAVSALQPLKMDLQDMLSELDAAPVARGAIRDARRSAAGALSTRSAGLVGGAATDDATAFRARLDATRGLDDTKKALGSALFEVQRAKDTAERISAQQTSDRLTVAEISKISQVLIYALLPHRPGHLVTSLELPYRLLQSPHSNASFVHPTAPVTLSDRTELWRTTLMRRTTSDPAPIGPNGLPITVMWSPDYTGSAAPKKDPFRMSLAPRHRDDLVRLMSGHTEQLATTGKSYTPTPARARRLQLSAWGGVLEADGEWMVDVQGVDTEEWKHDASYGRDEFVRVVEGGFLFPFGHRAAFVTLTQREIEDHTASGCGAFLRQRRFIVLREAVKSFPAPGMVHDGRKLPFKTITCLTRKTPALDSPSNALSSVAGLNEMQAFWPVANNEGSPFRFEFEAVDISGRRTTFKSNVIFVFKSLAFPPANQINKVQTGFAGAGSSINDRSRVPFEGQVVRMAPVGDGTPGDVDVPLDEVVFEGTSAQGQTPPFHPAVRCADARLKALEGVTGKTASETVEFEKGTYLPQGYTNNPWRVFLELKTPFKVDMGGDVPTDKVGGIGQPTQSLSAISNGSGAVSGSVSALTGGNVDPADMFPEAKILGGFDLKDIIAPFVAGALGQVPGFKTEEFPDKIVTSWNYKDDNITASIPGLVFGAGGQSTLELGAKLTAYFTYPDPDLGFKNKDGDPAPDFGAGTDPGWKDPEAEATGKLTNFKLDFFGFVIVWFDEFSFKSTVKKKFDPNPKLHDTDPVVFGGPLEFINTLSELIPSGGFSDPPIIKPGLTDLQVGYDFKLPNVEVGIFALKNMKIGAILTIPFQGDPVALKFFFNTREAPFLLTVSMFGGGGFFALVTTADGIQEVEAAFEFGAFASFDIGVASGGVYVKGGVYFHWKTDAVTLEGYVEMGGELSVLGLISVSVTFHLSLGYYKEAGNSYVKGQATLTVEVEVLFFSASVKLKVERKFSGSPGDPTFAQLIPDATVWEDYCSAFG